MVVPILREPFGQCGVLKLSNIEYFVIKIHNLIYARVDFLTPIAANVQVMNLNGLQMSSDINGWLSNNCTA